MSDHLLIAKLDELIAAAKGAGRDRWLDYAGVADLIGHTAEHVRQRIVILPDFPLPARPNGGHPRWRESEVHAWMASQVRSN